VINCLALLELGGGSKSQELGTLASVANAKRSSGPKTAAGKQNSSRNAFKHGLSRPRQPDSFTVEKIITSVGALISAPATEEQQLAAQHFACAQPELAQIQAIRAQQ
jgi:hypothetical protein